MTFTMVLGRAQEGGCPSLVHVIKRNLVRLLPRLAQKHELADAKVDGVVVHDDVCDLAYGPVVLRVGSTHGMHEEAEADHPVGQRLGDSVVVAVGENEALAVNGDGDLCLRANVHGVASRQALVDHAGVGVKLGEGDNTLGHAHLVHEPGLVHQAINADRDALHLGNGADAVGDCIREARAKEADGVALEVLTINGTQEGHLPLLVRLAVQAGEDEDVLLGGGGAAVHARAPKDLDVLDSRGLDELRVLDNPAEVVDILVELIRGGNRDVYSPGVGRPPWLLHHIVHCRVVVFHVLVWVEMVYRLTAPVGVLAHGGPTPNHYQGIRGPPFLFEPVVAVKCIIRVQPALRRADVAVCGRVFPGVFPHQHLCSQDVVGQIPWQVTPPAGAVTEISISLCKVCNDQSCGIRRWLNGECQKFLKSTCSN
mmetsp:Transcript_34692/g.98303  ORF Transcript_34692/g.98303 Transcript_34692/m.98303 type:complete len:425 (-) Transcript_34692:211-1485(-)